MDVVTVIAGLGLFDIRLELARDQAEPFGHS